MKYDAGRIHLLGPHPCGLHMTPASRFCDSYSPSPDCDASHKMVRTVLTKPSPACREVAQAVNVTLQSNDTKCLQSIII